MPQPQAPVPDDEDYNSASDEDFRPDDVHSDSASEKSGASREEEGGEAGRQRRRTTQPKRKKARTGSPGQLDSGDETVAVRGKSYRADGARASRQKTRRRTQDGDGDGDRSVSPYDFPLNITRG